MSAAYRAVLEKMRLAFPQPVSNPVHDSYFVHSILRALDAVDGMKSDLPILGQAEPLDYAAATQARLHEQPTSIEKVTAGLVDYLEGIQVFGHPRWQENVLTQPAVPSLIGVLLSSLYNPNIGWDHTSRRVALAELELAALSADLVGYDPGQAAGVFTFGGTGTNLYGAKIGLEKACPGAMADGLRQDVVLFASDASHYARYNVAGWLGIGTRNIVTVPTDAANGIDLEALEAEFRRALDGGRRVAALIATMGSTDAFGLDDLEAMVEMRDRLAAKYGLDYRPHVHADAVIGWAWSVFNDYDIEA